MNSYDRVYSLLVEATRVRSNPGGEEGEELRASFPYKGKGKAYHDREGYEEGEYARSGEWSSPNKSDAPKGHNFSSSRTRKIMGKRKASTPKALPKGTKITGLGSAEGASTKELAQRARDHGRGEDEYEGLKKGDPKYHERAVASAKAGTHKPSWVAQTGDDEVGMGGGRTALRHHQIAGVDPKVDTVARADMKRAAKSAERRDTSEKSGKLAKIRARLAKDGKTMREMNSYERTYNLLTESLSQAAKQTLANNRLSKKAFSRKDFNTALERVVKREDARRRIKRSPKRDVVRGAQLASRTYAPKHSLAYLPKPSQSSKKKKK